jgi:hypothetical protein
MYVYDNIEAFSCNHCCSGKVVIITYCECVFAALGIQHAIRNAPYCHLWHARLYNIFHIIFKRHDVRNRSYGILRVCSVLYNSCFKYFSFLEEMGEI